MDRSLNDDKIEGLTGQWTMTPVDTSVPPEKVSKIGRRKITPADDSVPAEDEPLPLLEPKTRLIIRAIALGMLVGSIPLLIFAIGYLSYVLNS